MNYIIQNHKLIKKSHSRISPQDRGFRFGDGVFETCLIKSGVIYNFTAHFARLEAGLKAIKIEFNSTDLIQSCQKLITKNKIKNGILRISVSRGVGSFGYLPIKNIKPSLIIETLKKPTKPKSPVKLMVSSYEKISLKSLPINHKLANGLNSILVKIEALEKDFFDGITLNEEGQVCETSSANIFWIKDDILFTPNLDCGLLNGTTRQKIINFSPLEIIFTKAKIDDLLKADEVFLTNASLGIFAVDVIENKQFLSKKYSNIFAKILQKNITEYVKEN